MLNYRSAGAIALWVALVLLSSWEYYWRSQGRSPDIDDNRDLWAAQRARVDKLDSLDVILVGSSRVLYDIDLDEWQQSYGCKPVQLAFPGSVPHPVFRDLVENTAFNGTIIIGVTPGFFFREIDTLGWAWDRSQSKVDHFNKRTLADRLNHWLSIPFQENFVFVASSEEEWDDDIDLRSLIRRMEIGDREGDGRGNPFYNFIDVRTDRDIHLKSRMETDTALIGTIQRAWMAGGISRMSSPQTCGVIDYLLPILDKFRARGGNPIFVRCPSSGPFIEKEHEKMPRDSTWDILLFETGTPGVHFEDHEQLQGLHLPEWSHLSAPSSRIFTRELVSILKEESLLRTSKSE